MLHIDRLSLFTVITLLQFILLYSFCKWISFSLQAKDMWCSLSCRITLEIIRIVCAAKFSSRPSRSLSPHCYLISFESFVTTFFCTLSIWKAFHGRTKMLALIRSFTSIPFVVSHVAQHFDSIAVGILRNSGVNLDGPTTLQKSVWKSTKNETQRNETKNSCVLYLEFFSDCLCAGDNLQSYRCAPWLKMVCHICILLHSQ